ncbi:MAG: hypothetical protein ABR548_13145 [Actinomycetota bacterium]|nr:DUF2007 domain-containing protein [Actinomycetota bacterium]
MPYCPVCRDEFRPGFTTCPDHNAALVDVLEEDARPLDADVVLGAELGEYERVRAPIVIDLLAEEGIRATIADALSEIYRTSHPERSTVFVEKKDLDRARIIVRDRLPARLRELEEVVAADPNFAEGAQESPTGAWGLPAPAEAVEEYDADPIGYMEPVVARVLLSLCEDIEIGADSEYPLDSPPPPYARADGRVRIHIERGFKDHALQLMEDDLAGELAARGIAHKEPLLLTEEDA